MAHQGQLPPKATFAVRHHLVNVNSVGLRLLLENRRETRLMQVEPLRLDPIVDSYAAWLNAGDEGQSCVLITMDSNRGEFRPAPDPAAMAVTAGFRPAGEVALPRGQVMTAWRRVSAACPPERR